MRQKKWRTELQKRSRCTIGSAASRILGLTLTQRTNQVPTQDRERSPVPDAPDGARFYLGVLRSFSFPASIVGILVGTAAALPLRQWRWDVLVAELLAVPLIHAVGNLLNDYFDYRSGVDRRTVEDDGRPGRFLVRGLITPAQILCYAAVCSALLAPLAAFLVWKGGWPAVGVGLLGLAGAYAYTGPPFVLKYRGLGELCIFVVFGAVIVAGASYMQTGRFDPIVILHALPLGMLIVAILASNNLRDIEEDAQADIRTLAHRIGRKPYLVLCLILLFAPAPLLVAGALARMTSWWSLLALLALPLGATPARLALREVRRPDVDAVTARYMTAFGALMSLGLVIGNWR